MSTLNDYTPKTLDDLSGESPQSVLDAFDSINRWTTSIELPMLDTRVFVGDKLEGNRNAWVLYHDPRDPDNHAVAGVLYRQNEFRDELPPLVGFRDAGDEPPLDDHDQQLVRVDNMTVEPHTRTEELETVLDAVRTDITDTDWENSDRPDTSVDEWQRGLVTLTDFRQDAYDDAPFLLPPNLMMGSPRIMHGIARYPMHNEKFISHLANGVRNALDNGTYEANPEAIRTVIADYAKTHLDVEDTPSLGVL